MPPSTVFSYWRRDHRRSTAPPASLPAPSPTSKGATDSPLSNPPQLPEIPDTPTLTTPFDGDQSYDAPPQTGSPLDIDTSKLNFNTSVAPLSSSVSLAVPSPSFEKENRPHSSPEECLPEPDFTSKPNSSQLADGGLRPDQGDGESSSKPNSPFRLSFGKGLRNLQTPAAEGSRRSPTTGPGSHFGLKTPPDESPSEKPIMSQKEFRAEGALTRRAGDREFSGEHAHHKSGKAMLHLLNPMSLLARRRSSQMGTSRVDNPKIGAPSSIPAIPDDYDPRIRGKIVHDFSAPRPRRNVSGTPAPPPPDGNSNIQDASPSQAGLSPASRWNDQTKRHSDHSPVFKEHFEDDRNVLQPENKGYLQSSLLTNSQNHRYEKSIPVFARKLPSHLPEQQSPESTEQNVSPPAELPAEEAKTSPPTEQQNQPDQDIIPNVSHLPSSLPRHLKSNASRFSFDMGGVESSVEEKLLEEKHKAKEAARKMEDGYFDDFDDEFDHDLLDDVDGLEEKIPGVNADADDDDFSSPYLNVKSWAAPKLSPVVASPITPAPPEIPADVTGTSYLDPEADSPTSSYSFSDTATQPDFTEIEESHEAQQPSSITGTEFLGAAPQVPDANKQQEQIIDDEDDLYFDDGEFGDLSLDDRDGGFDESVFDDETSHLYERRPVAQQTAGHPPQTEAPDDDSPHQEIDLEENTTQGLKHMPSVASNYRTTSVKRGPLGEPIPNMGPARTHGGVLTEQNLEVLHNALAFAANEAASKSRIERNISTSDRSLGQESISQTSQTVDSQPGLISDDSRLSQGPDFMAFEETYDDQIFDDDAYWDDAIVAAANAEALENDDEGFYGQEFGFYAEAHNSSGSELTNGGYFGPRGVEGITRSHSSRGKFQEPSLTPITERSEWSTRNSLISLKAHGATHSNPSLASPGLAQLVDMGNLDDELSLSALMKLRRGAWGGSNGSLRSSAGSPPPHTLSSSNRASFTGLSEASLSDARSSADEGLAGMGYHQEDHLYTASPLKDLADLPIRGTGPSSAESDFEMPASTSLHLNVL